MSHTLVTCASADEWREHLSQLREESLTVGFVPTMGALHEGHLSLVRRSLAETDRTVVSVFVNPTQFNDPEDLDSYPRDLEADRRLLEEVGAHFLVVPSEQEIYRDEYRYRVTESEVSRVLEGAQRPGHFDGVMTVVLRLFGIVRPDRAFFGEKDYQQLLLVGGMGEAFGLDVEVVGCPTVREEDGLAMSSRNRLLNVADRWLASEWARLLREGSSAEAVRAGLADRGIEVEYVEDRWGRRLGAVVIGGVRLIDNVPL